MPLAACPECRKRVSTQADACPGCGYPLARDAAWKARAPAPSRRGRRIVVAFAFVAAAAAGWFLTRAPARVDGPVEWVAIDGGDLPRGETSVRLPPFRIARTEVTVAQYRACFDAGACTPPDAGRGACNWGRAGRDDHPVNCVDREQARAFARWAGGRLPTGDEWEMAARGEAGREFPWGSAAATCERAVMIDCGGDETAPVCSRPAGHTPEGVCDMAGNVWEWVEDAPGVQRGGAWYGYAEVMRATSRTEAPPDARDDFRGFRPVR